MPDKSTAQTLWSSTARIVRGFKKGKASLYYLGYLAALAESQWGMILSDHSCYDDEDFIWFMTKHSMNPYQHTVFDVLEKMKQVGYDPEQED